MPGPNQPPPILVQPPFPTDDIGTTGYLTDSSPQSIARKSFKRSRSTCAQIYWDPLKNGPQKTLLNAIAANKTSDGLTAIYALGKIKIGNSAAQAIYAFDVPYGQYLAVPVVAEQVEVTVRLINAPPPAGDLDFSWNDPAPFTAAAGVNLPNVGGIYPKGFIAITGAVGEGSASPYNAAPLTRTRVMTGLIAGANILTALAFGARRVMLITSDAYTATFQVNEDAGTTGATFPPNVLVDIPAGTLAVNVHNPTAGGLGAFTLVFELGI